jgi:hypothetical protein
MYALKDISKFKMNAVVVFHGDKMEDLICEERSNDTHNYITTDVGHVIGFELQGEELYIEVMFARSGRKACHPEDLKILE